MKPNFSEIVHQLRFISLSGVVLSLLFNLPGIQLNGFFIILFTLTSVVVLIAEGKKNITGSKWGVLILSSVYIMLLISFLRTDNSEMASEELVRKVGLILFPVLFYLSRPFSELRINWLFTLFIIATTIGGVAAILIGWMRVMGGMDPQGMYSHKLSENIGMHPNYLAMYSCFAIMILVVFFWKRRLEQKPMNRLLIFGVIAVNFTVIVLLGARAQIFILGICLVGCSLFWAARMGAWKKMLWVPFVALGVLTTIFIVSPVNREKLKELVNYNNEYSINKQWGGRALRELKWSCALSVFSENPFCGVGVGDVQDALDDCYREKKYNALLFWENTRYNAHNQFLETLVGQGVFGGAVLVIMALYSFQIALRRRDLIYFLFLIIFMMSCLTESMLERQNGVVFFALFNSLFVFRNVGSAVQLPVFAKEAVG